MASASQTAATDTRNVFFLSTPTPWSLAKRLNASTFARFSAPAEGPRCVKPTRLFSKVTREMGADIEGWHEVCASCIDAARAADAERDGWMTRKPRIGPFRKAVWMKRSALPLV